MPAIDTPPAPPAARRALAPRRFSGVVREFSRPARTARPGAAGMARRPGAAAVPASCGAVATARPLRLHDTPIDLVTITDAEALAVHEQLVADGLIAELEAQARRAQRSGYERAAGLAHAERYPSLPQWLALRGSAFSLHPLYRPSQARRLAQGFAFEDFLTPIFDGESAVDVLRALLGAERAGAVIDRHRAFCDAPMTDEARLLMAGAIDARAIRQRALIATHALVARRERWDAGGARVAAVAGGTGDAVGQIAAGIGATSLHLIDRDPLALAAATVLTSKRVPDLYVQPTLARRGAAAELAAAGSFDVIDLSGALDTLADGAVVELLRSARHALRPGGVVVAASMLDQRPQQTLLDHVLQWPTVIQRSADQLAGLIDAAGFPAASVSLAIPATAPVYAIATIDGTPG